MAVNTPKHWQSMELTKARTAYGNEVMIPKKLIKGWKGLKEMNDLALKNGVDMSIGEQTIQHRLK